MALENWYVKRVERNCIKDFIETWHYSKSINGCMTDYCYALYDNNDEMKGAMFFGRLAMANQWKRFSDRAEDVIELRRLCCVDDTPRNAESFFISRAIKLLKKEWKGKIIVSYSDLEYGHSGVIYKASNFEFLGFRKGAKVIVTDNKVYHDKAIRTKGNDGKLKPFAIRLKKELDEGRAYYKTTKGKNTFVYRLRKKK